MPTELHRRAAGSDRKLATSWSSLILWITGGYLACGLLVFIAWRVTNNDAVIVAFFRSPGALLLIALASTALLLSTRVAGLFLFGEPLRIAWRLITLAAASELAGTLLVQIPVSRFAGLRDLGSTLGGPVRFGILAAALLFVLRVYKRSGFLGRLAVIDWIILALFGVYVANEAAGVVTAFRHGKRTTWAEVLHLPVDPLLCILLAEALLLYRSIRAMGGGAVGHCYGAFCAGICLILLGDVSMWAFAYGYLPWPWNSIGWYIWIPAAAAFALAPAYQLQAMRQAASAGAHDL